MVETGHQLGSTHLSKAAFEEYLADGLRNMNALMQLSKDEELILNPEDWQSFINALYAVDRFLQQMYKSIT